MSNSNPKLEWCVVRLGEDLNWWVAEISDPIHWDVDGLGVVDPRQMSYIIEQCDALREYGFDPDIIDEAFFAFRIESEKDGQVRMVLAKESFLEEESLLFALPDVVDDERGPFADFLDQVTKFRVKMLNDLIDFDQNLTVDELEDEIRERHNQEYMEGRAVHPFTEITAILDYVPEGYELEDEEPRKSDEEDIDDIPDFEDEDEKIEEDDTMKWDEEEDEEDFEDDEDENGDDEEDDEDPEDDEEEDEGDEEPRPGKRR